MSENISRLISAVVENEEAFSIPWSSFAVVLTLDSDGDPIRSHGYLYKPDSDFEAISADLIATEEPVAAYLQEVYGDAQPPIKMLLQFDRVSGRFNVQFEDKDESRWQVRPADIHGYIEELRPKFDQ